MKLDGEAAQLYAGALEAIARVDGEITPEESAHMRELVSKRTSSPIDYEALFFDKVTAHKLGVAVHHDTLAIGRALVADGVVLATVDGDLNGAEAQAIIRFAHALGLKAADITGVTDQLAYWLHGD